MSRRSVFYPKGKERSIKIINALISLLFLVAIAAMSSALPLDSGSSNCAITEATPSLMGEWVKKADTQTVGGFGEAVVGAGGYIYVIRSYSTGSSYFWKYDPSNDRGVILKKWSDLLNSDFPRPKSGTALACDNNSYIYVMFGAAKEDSDRKFFYRYNITNDTWVPLECTPHPQGAGDAITWSGYDGYIYAMMGSRWPKHNGTGFARYNCSSSLWENLTLNPNWNTVTDDGASLVWTGGEYLYALQGEVEEEKPNFNFSRYHIPTGRWENVRHIPKPKDEGVGDGASLLWIGNWLSEYTDYIFSLGGGSCVDSDGDSKEDPGDSFYCYSVSHDKWESLKSVPCPIGEYVGNRLGFANGHIYYWQGSLEKYDHDCRGKAFYMFKWLPVVFDTGKPINPYPSIFGTHNGTLTPNQTISVHKLYTYPCKGTGGHTEYVKFWNLTWNVTANWNGYRGDWHNVSFNESFTLVNGETYNYTFRTGSYPQIHHTPARPTANGWINCSEFVDANGRVYYDWIPAIKLYF